VSHQKEKNMNRDVGARQCALKGVSHSGLETSARQAVSCGTGSEFCVVHGNMHCEA
jgi:hypothetical protein